ncbi:MULTISPECIES: hypothetical protein [unclassified Brevundimonas]|uniref:hypothetical protein n=1 Tax=unclassified Brevundimonas TaxID=2622653 RepID=UPI0025C22CF5|nr:MULTISPECIES: hypothetical protein [unclassified Brevundimonas]
MTALICAVLVALIVGVIVLTAIVGWGARVTRCQRVGLIVCASGLVLAGPSRFYGQPVGYADLMFVGGLAVYLLGRNLKFILRKADGLDGVEDGRLALPATPELVARLKQISRGR